MHNWVSNKKTNELNQNGRFLRSVSYIFVINFVQEKLLFCINETLLEKGSINLHFQREQHKKLFLDKQIEFMCRKGKTSGTNQDNFFILLDGDVKIYGLFDGHGQNGHQVSSFAQSKVMDFIRNKNGAFFEMLHLEQAS